MTRTFSSGLRTPVTSKMEPLVAIVNDLGPLTVFTKPTISDGAVVLDMPCTLIYIYFQALSIYIYVMTVKWHVISKYEMCKVNCYS